MSVTFQCPINPHFTPFCGFLKDRSPQNSMPTPYLGFFFLFFPCKASFLVFSDLFPACFPSFHSLQWSCTSLGTQWSPAVTLVGCSGYTALESQPALELSAAAAPKTPSERLPCSTACVAVRQLLCELPSKSLN